MPHSTLVLTLIGPDRTGLVEAVAAAVAEHDGNWLESRMARLAGQFAGILRVSVPTDKSDALALALRALEGLEVIAGPAIEGGPADGDRARARLELVGQDRPGIVRNLSAALVARNINVEELETECAPAPMSGETLFRARALLSAPDPGALQSLREALERLGADLMVEISLTTD